MISGKCEVQPSHDISPLTVMWSLEHLNILYIPWAEIRDVNQKASWVISYISPRTCLNTEIFLSCFTVMFNWLFIELLSDNLCVILTNSFLRAFTCKYFVGLLYVMEMKTGTDAFIFVLSYNNVFLRPLTWSQMVFILMAFIISKLFVWFLQAFSICTVLYIS